MLLIAYTSFAVECLVNAVSKKSHDDLSGTPCIYYLGRLAVGRGCNRTVWPILFLNQSKKVASFNEMLDYHLTILIRSRGLTQGI